MSQFKDDFALNCGFQHQGGATCTTAPAVLETELQFPFTHPGSSFFDAFLVKRILSTGGRLRTPWVQLTIQLGNITLFESECHGKRECLMRVHTQKRNEGLQALFGLGGFLDTLASLKRGGQGRVSRKTIQNGLGSPGKRNAKTLSVRSSRAFSFF